MCAVLTTRYTPDQAILAIAGRFDPDAVRRLLAQRFAGIPRRGAAQYSAVRRLVLRGTTTEHHADIDEATALVAVPAAPWGSLDSFDDELIDRLLLGRLRQLDRDERWVTGVDAGTFGGRRNGVRYFAVSVAEPRWLDEAFMKIFRIAAELPGNDNGLALGAVAAQRRTVLFSDFESVFDRGGHCADYLQFTNHGSFHLHELAALQAIDTDRLQKRARHLTRTASHMVKVFPSASPGAARTARPVLHAAAAIETHLWQAPVEPAEAGRPLSLPEPRRPPAVTELHCRTACAW